MRAAAVGARSADNAGAGPLADAATARLDAGTGRGGNNDGMRAATVERTDTPASATDDDDDRAGVGAGPIRHPIRAAATTPAMTRPIASRCRATANRGSANARRAHAAMRIPQADCKPSSGQAGGSNQPSASGRNAVGGVRPRAGRGWIDEAAADNGSSVAGLDQRFCTCARQARHHDFKSIRNA
ncbi:hypothetical protein B0E47_07490 [Rhodanobacter sp. B05]|nr:hypothetical protein B0E47_07490 [Rhodanobacter sp. B05]